MSEVFLEGFDDESISFQVRGSAARVIANMVGDPFGFAPNRIHAEVSVTLYGEDLTDGIYSGNAQARGDDSSYSLEL